MTSDGGVTWTDIPGAAATTYTPPAGSAGKQLRVLVTGTNSDGNSQAADSLAGKTGSQAAQAQAQTAQAQASEAEPWETKGQARASATPVAPGAAVAATRASLSFDVFGVVNRVRISPAKI